VFGDCDALMAAVMRLILDEDTLKDWEEGTALRMKEYDRIRGESNFQCSCVIWKHWTWYIGILLTWRE